MTATTFRRPTSVQMSSHRSQRRFRPAVEPLESRDVPATIFALTSGNQLVSFDSADPGTILSTVNITGLAAGDQLQSIDFSPGSNTLFGLALQSSGSVAHLYSINATTGVVTTRIPSLIPSFGSLTGTNYGVDFNAFGGKFRVAGDGDENITATVNLPSTDSRADLAYVTGDVNAGANPAVVSLAHDKNSQLATNQTVFGIDAGTDSLVRIGSEGGSPDSADTGKLFTVGQLAVGGARVNAVAGAVGFDIGDGAVERAFLSLAADTAAGTRAKLYRVRLGDGALADEGFIGPTAGSFNIRDIAVALVGHVRFEQTAVTVTEGAGTLDVTLRRSTASQFATDVTVGVASGSTASVGADFTLGTTTVTFNPGDQSKTVTINLTNDAIFEGAETIVLQLTAGTNNVARSPSTLTVTLVDDDPPPSPPVQAPPPLTAVLFSRRVRTTRRLFLRVLFADSGQVKREFASPFQKPVFRGIAVTLLDTDGNGAADTVVLTARKGKKLVQRSIPA